MVAIILGLMIGIGAWGLAWFWAAVVWIAGAVGAVLWFIVALVVVLRGGG